MMVHCGLGQFEGFTGKPKDIIEQLHGALGEGGTLLMPTLPFSGLATEWAESGVVFDPRRTPSAMGLVTEMFRRGAGVVRSIHPTHSVAARGPRAAAMCEGHHLCDTPCGIGSPYARLLEEDGSILLLGVDIRAMTFFHAAEAILEEKHPFSPFTEKRYRLSSRDGRGGELITETRLFDPEHSRRRDCRLMIPELKKRGAWRQGRLQRLQALHLRAREVLAVIEAMADRGEFCYHPPGK